MSVSPHEQFEAACVRQAVENAKAYALANDCELSMGGVNPKCCSRDLARFSCILCQTAFLKGWLEACLPQASQSTHDAALEKALEFLCPSDEFRDAAFLALTILDNPLVETTSLAARLNQDRRRGFCRAFDLQPKDSK